MDNKKVGIELGIPEVDLKNIIINGDTQCLIKKAEELGKALAKEEKDEKGLTKLTNSQIRNFFGTVKKIEAKGFNEASKRDFLLLKPKLAYAAKRADRTRFPILANVLTRSIDIVIFSEQSNEGDKFKKFCDLFEAILCYFKANEENKEKEG